MFSTHWTSPAVAVVKLDAAHTITTHDFAVVRQTLLDLAGRCDRLILDFSATRTFDGAFLGVLATAWSRMGPRRTGFALCGLDEHGTALLRACHLDRVWSIAPTHRAILGAQASPLGDDPLPACHGIAPGVGGASVGTSNDPSPSAA